MCPRGRKRRRYMLLLALPLRLRFLGDIFSAIGYSIKLAFSVEFPKLENGKNQMKIRV